MGVQVLGDHNTVLVAGEARLVLYRAHRARRPPANERELLLTELRVTTLVGRDDGLKALESWLRSARPISVRCLTGEGGAGKTRLGIELCERAEAGGWAAGFARHDDLRRFHAQHSPTEWRWPRPTLVVVDYAAASIEVLRAWLEALARRVAEAKEPPLRVLLLERYADREAGWWAELLRPGGLAGRSPADLFDPAEPKALRPLPNLEARRALLAEAMAETARFKGITPVPVPPSPGTDAAFDERLARDSIESEPLYLLMAGIVAVTSGPPAALALSRIDLAQRVADSERDRLIRLANSARVDADLVLHLAACATLQGGCEPVAAHTLVEQERDALRDRSGARTDQLVRFLHDALRPAAGSGVDAVRPNLIGEAFLVRELCQRPAEEQADIVARAFQRAAQGVVETLVRTAQDLAEGSEAHPAVAWLDHLALTEDPSALIVIANALPMQMPELNERAVKITSRIAEALRAQSADNSLFSLPLAQSINSLAFRLRVAGRPKEALKAAQEAVDLYRGLLGRRVPDAFQPPDLPISLGNLAALLSDLGRREEALEAAQEAVRIGRAQAARGPDWGRPNLAFALSVRAMILRELGRRKEALAAAQEAVEMRRTLAAQRPDAFRPNLAISLMVLAICLDGMGQHDDAVAANAEAIATLSDAFRRHPAAFDGEIGGMVREYVERCQKLGRKPDMGLLTPVLAVFPALQADGAKESPDQSS